MLETGPRPEKQRLMTHWNNSILCAIDLETTGLDPRKHDIVEVAIIPLNSEIMPIKQIMPFNVIIKPGRPENIDYDNLTKIGMTRKRISDYMLNGHDSFYAAELLEKWFNKLQMPERKQIFPLAHNFPFEYSFLRDWLGPLNYESMFDGRFRDTMALANALNEMADLRARPVPFEKVNLSYICNKLGIERSREHYALEDAMVTAECYRRMCMGY